AANSRSLGLTPSHGARRVTPSCPVVSVPVLSKTNAVKRAAASKSATSFTRIPSRAAAESAATIALGVARINAHGHAVTSNAITRFQSLVKNQTNPAIINTAGV